MNTTKNFWRLGMLVFAAMSVGPGVATGLAAPHQDGETTATDVKEKAVETYETMKDYTLEQRDEAMTAAEKKLKQLDVRIEEMQKSLDDRWQEMSDATREKTQETLNELRKERENVAEWYGGMRHSSAEAWEDVKKGFADSFDRLEKAFKKAKKNFENE
jgi:TolA-binding protein